MPDWSDLPKLQGGGPKWAPLSANGEGGGDVWNGATGSGNGDPTNASWEDITSAAPSYDPMAPTSQEEAEHAKRVDETIEKANDPFRDQAILAAQIQWAINGATEPLEKVSEAAADKYDALGKDEKNSFFEDIYQENAQKEAEQGVQDALRDYENSTQEMNKLIEDYRREETAKANGWSLPSFEAMTKSATSNPFGNIAGPPPAGPFDQFLDKPASQTLPDLFKMSSTELKNSTDNTLANVYKDQAKEQEAIANNDTRPWEERMAAQLKAYELNQLSQSHLNSAEQRTTNNQWSKVSKTDEYTKYQAAKTDYEDTKKLLEQATDPADKKELETQLYYQSKNLNSTYEKLKNSAQKDYGLDIANMSSNSTQQTDDSEKKIFSSENFFNQTTPGLAPSNTVYIYGTLADGTLYKKEEVPLFTVKGNSLVNQGDNKVIYTYNSQSELERAIQNETSTILGTKVQNNDYVQLKDQGNQTYQVHIDGQTGDVSLSRVNVDNSRMFDKIIADNHAEVQKEQELYEKAANALGKDGFNDLMDAFSKQRGMATSTEQEIGIRRNQISSLESLFQREDPKAALETYAKVVNKSVDNYRDARFLSNAIQSAEDRPLFSNTYETLAKGINTLAGADVLPTSQLFVDELKNQYNTAESLRTLRDKIDEAEKNGDTEKLKLFQEQYKRLKIEFDSSVEANKLRANAFDLLTEAAVNTATLPLTSAAGAIESQIEKRLVTTLADVAVSEGIQVTTNMTAREITFQIFKNALGEGAEEIAEEATQRLIEGYFKGELDPVEFTDALIDSGLFGAALGGSLAGLNIAKVVNDLSSALTSLNLSGREYTGAVGAEPVSFTSVFTRPGETPTERTYTGGGTQRSDGETIGAPRVDAPVSGGARDGTILGIPLLNTAVSGEQTNSPAELVTQLMANPAFQALSPAAQQTTLQTAINTLNFGNGNTAAGNTSRSSSSEPFQFISANNSTNPPNSTASQTPNVTKTRNPDGSYTVGDGEHIFKVEPPSSRSEAGSNPSSPVSKLPPEGAAGDNKGGFIGSDPDPGSSGSASNPIPGNSPGSGRTTVQNTADRKTSEIPLEDPSPSSSNGKKLDATQRKNDVTADDIPPSPSPMEKKAANPNYTVTGGEPAPEAVKKSALGNDKATSDDLPQQPDSYSTSSRADAKLIKPSTEVKTSEEQLASVKKEMETLQKIKQNLTDRFNNTVEKTLRGELLSKDEELFNGNLPENQKQLNEALAKLTYQQNSLELSLGLKDPTKTFTNSNAQVLTDPAQGFKNPDEAAATLQKINELQNQSSALQTYATELKANPDKVPNPETALKQAQDKQTKIEEVADAINNGKPLSAEQTKLAQEVFGVGKNPNKTVADLDRYTQELEVLTGKRDPAELFNIKPRDPAQGFRRQDGSLDQQKVLSVLDDLINRLEPEDMTPAVIAYKQNLEVGLLKDAYFKSGNYTTVKDQVSIESVKTFEDALRQAEHELGNAERTPELLKQTENRLPTQEIQDPATRSAQARQEAANATLSYNVLLVNKENTLYRERLNNINRAEVLEAKQQNEPLSEEEADELNKLKARDAILKPIVKAQEEKLQNLRDEIRPLKEQLAAQEAALQESAPNEYQQYVDLFSERHKFSDPAKGENYINATQGIEVNNRYIALATDRLKDPNLTLDEILSLEKDLERFTAQRDSFQKDLDAANAKLADLKQQNPDLYEKVKAYDETKQKLLEQNHQVHEITLYLETKSSSFIHEQLQNNEKYIANIKENYKNNPNVLAQITYLEGLPPKEVKKRLDAVEKAGDDARNLAELLHQYTKNPVTESLEAPTSPVTKNNPKVTAADDFESQKAVSSNKDKMTVDDTPDTNTAPSSEKPVPPTKETPPKDPFAKMKEMQARLKNKQQPPQAPDVLPDKKASSAKASNETAADEIPTNTPNTPPTGATNNNIKLLMFQLLNEKLNGGTTNPSSSKGKTTELNRNTTEIQLESATATNSGVAQTTNEASPFSGITTLSNGLTTATNSSFLPSTELTPGMDSQLYENTVIGPEDLEVSGDQTLDYNTSNNDINGFETTQSDIETDLPPIQQAYFVFPNDADLKALTLEEKADFIYDTIGLTGTERTLDNAKKKLNELMNEQFPKAEKARENNNIAEAEKAEKIGANAFTLLRGITGFEKELQNVPPILQQGFTLPPEKRPTLQGRAEDIYNALNLKGEERNLEIARKKLNEMMENGAKQKERAWQKAVLSGNQEAMRELETRPSYPSKLYMEAINIEIELEALPPLLKPGFVLPKGDIKNPDYIYNVLDLKGNKRTLLEAEKQLQQIADTEKQRLETATVNQNQEVINEAQKRYDDTSTLLKAVKTMQQERIPLRPIKIIDPRTPEGQKQLSESLGEPLNTQQLQQFFPELLSGQKVEQQSVGDCYLIASLNAVLQDPQARANLKDSISLKTYEDGSQVYQVKFYNKDGTISLVDVEANHRALQGTGFLGNPTVQRILNAGISILKSAGLPKSTVYKLEKALYDIAKAPQMKVKGSKGAEIIERAYLRLEDPQGKNQDKTLEDKTGGGHGINALRAITGWEGNILYSGVEGQKSPPSFANNMKNNPNGYKAYQEAEAFLKQLVDTPGKNIITLGTPATDAGGYTKRYGYVTPEQYARLSNNSQEKIRTYADPQYRFVNQHEYTLEKVTKEYGQYYVEIHNPHGEAYKIKLEEALGIFNLISYVKKP